MRHLVSLLASIAVFGCASTNKQETPTQDKQEQAAAPSTKLKRGHDVLVAMPKNGVFDQKEYRGSGQHTATAVQSAFAKFSDSIVVAPRCTDLNCLQAEGGSRYTYLIVPEILHWEDHRAEWSEDPDRVEVKLVIFDSRSSTEIASTVIANKSTSNNASRDHPQDLLPEPMKQYAESLY